MVDVMVESILVFLYFTFTLLLIPYGYNCFYMVWFSHKYRAPVFESLKNHAFVTVQLPVYNEKYVVERLIDSVCEMDWPRDKLEILVLDDSTDETRGIVDAEIEKQRRSGVDIRAVRREKSGDLRGATSMEAAGPNLGCGRSRAIVSAPGGEGRRRQLGTDPGQHRRSGCDLEGKPWKRRGRVRSRRGAKAGVREVGAKKSRARTHGLKGRGQPAQRA